MAPESRKRLRFKIEGMTCPSCEERLAAALKKLAGVDRVSVDFSRREALVEGEVSPEAVIRIVSEAGYRAAPREDGGDKPREVAIIGTGAAAMACALRLAEEGVEVVLVERGTVGGTCVNVGCIPSKFLIRAAEAAHTMATHPFAGVSHRRPRIDRRALLDQQQGIVERLRKEKYLKLIEENPHLTLIRGEARFLDPHRLEVERIEGGKSVVEADRFLIATGSSPAIPGIPGLEKTPFWTSTEALESDRVPERLIVLGGSYIAAELAQAFHRLGSKVTMLVRSRVLSREDPDLGEALTKAFREEGVEVRLGVQVEAVECSKLLFRRPRFRLKLTDGSQVSGDAFLIATGRRPNTEPLNLEAAGVSTDDRGAILVDDRLRTTNPRVYAAGDCTFLPQYVYVAALAGKRAAENMLGLERPLRLEPLPWVVFTDPQVAGVGLSEREAQAKGLEVEVRRFPVDQIPRAIVEGRRFGLVKLVAEKRSGRLLGARIVAPHAGEMIQTVAVALKAGLTIDDLTETLFPYLTMVEGIKLCAQSFRKEVGKLSCCAG